MERVNTTSKVGANSELNEDTPIARSATCNSKANYPRAALPLNILFLLLIFIGCNCFNVRSGIACIITIIIVQAIVNVGLLLAWNCMCLMNTLDDCDLL